MNILLRHFSKLKADRIRAIIHVHPLITLTHRQTPYTGNDTYSKVKGFSQESAHKRTDRHYHVHYLSASRLMKTFLECILSGNHFEKHPGLSILLMVASLRNVLDINPGNTEKNHPVKHHFCNNFSPHYILLIL